MRRMTFISAACICRRAWKIIGEDEKVTEISIVRDQIPNRECFLYLSHVTWMASCYEDFPKIKEITTTTYTCISRVKKPPSRSLWTGLFTSFVGGNTVFIYDAFVLFCFVLFFVAAVFYSGFVFSLFFGWGRGGYSSCVSEESSSKHIKLANVTLGSDRIHLDVSDPFVSKYV